MLVFRLPLLLLVVLLYDTEIISLEKLHLLLRMPRFGVQHAGCRRALLGAGEGRRAVSSVQSTAEAL